MFHLFPPSVLLSNCGSVLLDNLALWSEPRRGTLVERLGGVAAPRHRRRLGEFVAPRYLGTPSFGMLGGRLGGVIAPRRLGTPRELGYAWGV